MKKILVPVDFSDCSLHAVRYAANLAAKSDAAIVLLHVLNEDENAEEFSTSGEWTGSFSHAPEIPTMIGRLREVKARMQRLISAELADQHSVFDCIEVGPVAQQIQHAAKKYSTGLIVMGTHGASGLKEFFVGSNAEHVVRAADVPVLTVHDENFREPHSLVFASDFSESADKLFVPVREFAMLFGAEILLLNIATGQDDDSPVRIRKRIDAFRFRNNASRYPLHIRDGRTIEEGILHFANEHQAGLIAVGGHPRKGLGRWFGKSLPEEIVNHSFIPVLTLKFR